ncbi:serine-rich adhesin for platelets isoform X2 [Solenopsis invicta]|uniref:serine-rich adhesin for platelets isoform X2 n=1 Tax=Solenopsis invicta TaxID=13686 RepID=UPI00193E4C0F|nr:serine-rich adhesin for platelets isoform X2 [Solenopsis invicta]
MRMKDRLSAPTAESLQTSKHISQEEKFDKFPDIERYYYYCQDTNERDKNSPDLQYGVSCHDSSIVSSNGLHIFDVAPQWALPNNFMQWIDLQALVAHNTVQDIIDLYHKTKDITESIKLNSIYSSKLLLTARQNDRIVNSNVPTSTINESLSEKPGNLQKERKNRLDNCQKDFGEGTDSDLLNINKTTELTLVKDKTKILSESQKKICYDANISLFNCVSKHSINTQSTTRLKVTSDNIEHEREACDPNRTTSVADNEPLNLIINSKESTQRSHTCSETKDRFCNYLHSSGVAKETLPIVGAIVKQLDHSFNVQSFYNAKYKAVDYGLLKFSDLNELSCNSDKSKELLKTISKLHASGDEVNGKVTTNGDLKQETAHVLDKYVTHVLPSRLSDSKSKASSWTHLQSNVKCNNIKKECCSEEEARKSESTDLVTACNPRLSNWACFEMSGQYPGHSRPPVGTPPPQTVWNHLTMAQGQALNIHPTLSGPTLSPAGFYTHPSMARASHLSSQLTPQLAHTQAPPTWHTPTVPSKSVTPSNTPGNPLFNLQMLVDNRSNQNQYRNSPGSQSTLDLSSTSEIMAENYSRITQDIPISLTARNMDKGSRNGNIISPPLNGETSSDSGISSSVPTPNSVSEPVSLSTKELTTPKITVKNFESNLKGVANLHDKIKEMNVDNFTQKVINLPPSVTIERVVTDKKESEASAKVKDTLSVIAQVPRNVTLPVIVNLTSKMEKDVTDSPKRESSSERDKKHEETSVRSPKNLPKRGKKGVDSLLEKLEGGNKKLGSTENIGSVIVMPVEEKDTSSVKSMSPERQKSKSPTREDEVVSPAFSNDDSNDNTKQRRKRKLEKPVRLSKDSKTEVEDMELEPTEPTEPRTIDPLLEETTSSILVGDVRAEEQIARGTEDRISDKVTMDEVTEERSEECRPIRRRSNSEDTTASNSISTNQRTRRKSNEDTSSEFPKVMSPKDTSNSTTTTTTITTTTTTTTTNPFVEVESELAKMFAGIVEADPEVKNEESKVELANAQIQGDSAAVKFEGLENSILPMTESQNIQSNPIDVSSTVDTKLSGKKGKRGKMQGGKRKISRSTENIFGTTDDTPPKEVKKRRTSKGSKKQDQASKKAKKNTKIDGLREMAYDSGSNASSIRSRGPVVHVEGPRDSPLSIQVVNAPREEEEEKSKEKRKSVGNGNGGRSKRLSHQNDLDYRGKVSRAGLFSSTLSSRYDAHTTDSTWVCVFCKQGPHSVIPGDPSRPHPNLAGPHIATGTYTVPAGVLSDLFGPYLIGKERLEDGILSADEQEITTEQKKGGRNKRSLRYAGLADQFSAKMGKKKRNIVESNTNAIFTGMTLHPGGEEQRWEVWLHEQCAVWAAGVYMAGGRVTGLQEAVWDAAKSVCDSCGLTGANIGCVRRGCKAVSHYPCALTKGWYLDTNQYIPKCNLHRVT